MILSKILIPILVLLSFLTITLLIPSVTLAHNPARTGPLLGSPGNPPCPEGHNLTDENQEGTVVFFCKHPDTSFLGVENPLGERFSVGGIGEIITKALPFVFTIAGVVALGFLIWGGFRYMLARGDPKAIEAAKSTITSAVIGLIIIISAVAIMTIIGTILNINIFSYASPAYAQQDIGEKFLLNGEGIRSVLETP